MVYIFKVETFGATNPEHDPEDKPEHDPEDKPEEHDPEDKSKRSRRIPFPTN